MAYIKYFSRNDLENIHFSQKINVFHERQAPEEGLSVGTGAVIDALKLSVPIPNVLAMISEKHRKYQKPGWLVFTPRHKPNDTLYGHLVFSLKYEGINLLFLKKLFEKVEEGVIESIVKNEPLGQYSRKIWFLYEWLLSKPLQVRDLKEGNYIPLVDKSLQYAIEKGVNSIRHRIRNNLPGTVDFCPMINKTDKLEKYIEEDLSKKASFNIEGETPSSTRANRWGKAIGQAGSRTLSKDELLRIQQIVIENQRFTKMGFRTEGGFVFIHPFSDGNGRIQRYLIHHILSKQGFTPQVIIFPVSAAILERIDDYRKVLEEYSHPVLDFIEWEKTPDNDVKVLNDTSDYYKYYDATKQTEFLFDCVNKTIETIIPHEVSYLRKYDEFKSWLDDQFEMPDKLVSLLVRFLEQNNGDLSNRARTKEIAILSNEETKLVEKQYQAIFQHND